MSHTPAKLVVCHSVDGITVDTAKPVRFNLTTAGTAVIAKVCEHADAEHFSGEANARRLVACWNACEGLTTEALEQSKPMAQLVIDHAMLTDALETVTNLLRGDGRFPATVAQLDITLEKHGRSA